MNAEVKLPDLTPPAKSAKTPKAAKEPKAPKEPKAAKVSRFKSLYPDEAVFTLLVTENPKRGKSKERFEGYFKADPKTVGEALKHGVTRADIAWDVGHGLIKIG
jgi:hypothetical protein